VAALLVAPAVAGGTHQGGKVGVTGAAGATGQEWSPNIVWAGTLMAMDVYNHHGEKLGRVIDLVFNHNQSRLSYAVLSYGIIPGLADKWFAVPWAAFRVSENGKALLLDVTKDRLENAPGFDKTKWPNMGDATFAADIEKFYGVEKKAHGEHGMKEHAARPLAGEHWWMRKYSALVGLDVRNLRGEHLADVENIGIDTREGRTVYGILSYGGILGVGEKLVAVPWSALEMRPELETARLDTDRKVLDALAFNQGNWPDLTNRDYARQLYEKFNREPYWEVYGYVKTEKDLSAGKNLTEAWAAGSEYIQRWDPKTVVTFSGTIESVGTFRPATGAAEGYRLRIKKENGDFVTIHAGPRSFVASQGLYYNYGDRVTITGSQGDFEGRTVIFVGKIVIGDKTLELRGEDGTPKWKEADIK
jgi:sporulation protein YlmC with PRC-barrel domain